MVEAQTHFCSLDSEFSEKILFFLIPYTRLASFASDMVPIASARMKVFGFWSMVYLRDDKLHSCPLPFTLGI
jgi:hypothetical protein